MKKTRDRTKPKKPFPSLTPCLPSARHSVPLISSHDFLDFFASKAKQCFFVRIPDTLIFSSSDGDSKRFLLENALGKSGKALLIRPRGIENPRVLMKLFRDRQHREELLPNPVPRAKRTRFAERLFKALKRFTYVPSLITL